MMETSLPNSAGDDVESTGMMQSRPRLVEAGAEKDVGKGRPLEDEWAESVEQALSENTKSLAFSRRLS